MPFIPRRRKDGQDEHPADEPREQAAADEAAAVPPVEAAGQTTDTELDLPDDEPQAAAATTGDSWGFDDPAGEVEVAQEAEAEVQPGTVSVVREESPVDPDDEYAWHTGVRHPTGMPDAVEFVETHKAFGRNRILRGLNMGLPEGMISMILGPSGTGKSVCIKHMVGLLYPDDGDILVHGESVPSMPLDTLLAMRRKFGVLFQDGALFGSMNILDNVAFPLRQHTDKSEDEVLSIVNRRMDEVGLADAWDKFPNELSGGMRKRAGFARALVLDPSIVLFDEPDSGLDPVRTALLGELIMEIHAEMMEEGKQKRLEHLPAFTLITHDIMTARRVAQYINVLWKGRIVEAGPAEQLFNSDNAFVNQFLAGASRGPLGMN
ncbi:putative ABC transport system ATP-binding protein [Patulibacter medicamentivorans]|uniref:Putative ABC transport system ATP-binding protein n=1 Tax=Patulibacter medicamentivorans TaxID=1097667 RepID=H0E7I2_9ACTN|nr:ATP-binding cassette domain-containing protein [Patulibacter medicamentivorans]EHN10353.1 putative ABC transport system ATP-binding protein [Patulibacter medicamentivorans]